jgi:hypothetical protein
LPLRPQHQVITLLTGVTLAQEISASTVYSAMVLHPMKW